ncbi:MAG: hypothetical protein H6599_00640 [Flavobacteriales bacterium]|nr:hypothetical protein [Flavobacteriales bacterium]
MSYSLEEVRNKLKNDRLYLRELPSMIQSNFAMYYSYKHQCYIRTAANISFDQERVSLSGPYFYNEEEFNDFFEDTGSFGYKDRHFAPIENIPDQLKHFDRLIDQAKIIMAGLKLNQLSGFEFGLNFLLQYKPVIGWYAVAETDRTPFWYNFIMEESRAYNEIINTLFKTNNNPIITELTSIVKERSLWVSDRIKKLFNNEVIPLAYYLRNETEGFHVLPSGEAFYITFKKEQKAIGKFTTEQFGYVDMDTLPEHLISIVKEGLKQDFEFMVSKFLKTSPKEHKGVLFEMIEDEKSIVTCFRAEDAKLNALYECLDYSKIYNAIETQSLIKSGVVNFTCGEFRSTDYRVQGDGEELYSPILNKSYPFVKTFNKVKLKRGFFAYYVQEKMNAFRTN